jgi:ATP-dependent DNA helicase RecG
MNSRGQNRLGIFTVNDLFNFFPAKYEDRRTVKKLNELENGRKALIRIKIVDQPKKSRIKRNFTVIKTAGRDETGFITLTFFNQDFLLDKLNCDEWFYAFGTVKGAFGKFEMTNPEIESESKDQKAGRIMPLYSLTKGLTNNELTKLVRGALLLYGDKIEDVMPEHISREQKLIPRRDAIKNLHFPEDVRKYSRSKKTIAYEKLLILQFGLLSIKNNLRSDLPGIEIKKTLLPDKLISSLPYKLTGAQLKVINEIKEDMRLPKPMNRLVQGDVGSGKTIVAVYAMLASVDSGFQASLMAPTEILAMQHYETINEYLELSGIYVKTAFLSGSTKAGEKDKILEDLREGRIDIIVGTHALIEDKVVFNNIGLVVTDEQHRFGVRQRALLSNKGKNPDILVMTATPIPRTLGLMMYGDLDISIIDEMPPGRQTIKTFIINKKQKSEAFSFIKENVKAGRQAYIVAPLVEDSENMELDSATTIFEELKNSYLSNIKLGLLHGKMKSSEKDEIIGSFFKGDIEVLVSTTVIEVGVNVPNATIMLILNAERFGLAQIHQLRGRVGRGIEQSYCILVNESSSKVSKDRMNIIKSTNNGFLIAEEDLRLRGPGDFFGTKQHGLSKFEVQNIVNDVEVVENVLNISKNIIKTNPCLEGDEYKNLKREIMNLFRDENIIFN